MTEDEKARWHQRLDEQEFEQASEVGEGQGGLACCSPWGCKEQDMTEQLNNNNKDLEAIGLDNLLVLDGCYIPLSIQTCGMCKIKFQVPPNTTCL